MKTTKDKIITEALERFRKEFVNQYSGDSGMGGNYPQEPVYELCESNPKEYERFFQEELQNAIDKSVDNEIKTFKEILKNNIIVYERRQQLPLFMDIGAKDHVAKKMFYDIGVDMSEHHSIVWNENSTQGTLKINTINIENVIKSLSKESETK